jgi:hypothetical protein
MVVSPFSFWEEILKPVLLPLIRAEANGKTGHVLEYILSPGEVVFAHERFLC